MICTYCRAHNEEDDHRCHRCGRRLSGEAFPVSRSAAAPKLQPVEAAEPAAPPRQRFEVVPPPVRRPETSPAARPTTQPVVQPSLFGPMEIARTQPAAKPQRSAPAQPRVRREKVEHPTLDFPVQSAHTLKTSVEAAIYCNAPVAIASQRCMAALIDTAIGLAGLGLFVATFHFAGYTVELSNRTLPIFAIAAALISLLYRGVFCFGNCDSIGLQATGLRLVHFDGRRPTRWERGFRLGGGIISVAALGIGLLWALADEEKLTWHDHMSKTFPTA